MTNKTKMLFAALAASASFAATGAVAQVGGIAVADPQAAVAGSAAFTAATTQIQTTYKAQLDQAETRRKAIQAELQPMITSFQTAQRAPGATQASLQPQYTAIQTREQAGQQELQRITAPAALAQAYVVEQIQAKLPDAVQNVIKAKNVGLLVKPDAVLLAQPAADITSAISAELNRLVPTVNAIPPAGWQPGQQGGTGPAAAAAAPASSSRRSGSR